MTQLRRRVVPFFVLTAKGQPGIVEASTLSGLPCVLTAVVFQSAAVCQV